MTFNVTDFLKKRKSLNIKVVTIGEAVDVELMALDADLIATMKAGANSINMIEFAADAGLSFARQRVIEDKSLSQDLAMLWSHPEMQVIEGESVYHQAGMLVIELSDLTMFIDDVIAEEKAVIAAEEKAQREIEEKAAAHEKALIENELVKFVDGDAPTTDGELTADGVDTNSLQADADAEDASNAA